MGFYIVWRHHSIKYKEKKLFNQSRSLTDKTIIKWPNSTSSNGTRWNHVPPDRVQWDKCNISVIVLPKNNLTYSSGKYPNPNWGTQQNNWAVIFQSIKVMKIRERLRNCFRMKETKEIQLNTTYDSRLDSFAIRTVLEQLAKYEWALRIRWWYCIKVNFLIVLVWGKYTLNFRGDRTACQQLYLKWFRKHSFYYSATFMSE